MKKVLLGVSLFLILSSCSLVNFQERSEEEVSINSDYNSQIKLMESENLEESFLA